MLSCIFLHPFELPQSYYYCYHHHHHHRHRHPRSLLHSSSAGSRNSTGLTDQAFLIDCPTENFVNIQHMLSITGALGLRRLRLPEFLDSRHTKVFKVVSSVMHSTSGVVEAVLLLLLLQLLLRKNSLCVRQFHRYLTGRMCPVRYCAAVSSPFYLMCQKDQFWYHSF